VLNLTVAAAIMLLRPRPAVRTSAPPAAARPAVPELRLMLAVAALTGASSFFYEIGWIRMLALVLGSSTHAFELMLSAFIFGIAFGGLAIRRAIDASRDLVRLLGYVQLAMGLAALATLPLYGSMFRVMELVLQSLSRNDSGYVAFNFASHAICLAVMFPAAFCAGMTLPLITAALLRRGAGERAIGQVYAANTAGAIAGVVLAVHVGFVLLGLKGLIVVGAAIDLALGVALLARVARLPALASGAVAALALIFVLQAVDLDAQRMASGVFRTGTLLNNKHKVALQLDGATATISVTANGELLSLRTNGKSDGVLRTDGGTTPDDAMMTLVGALPQFLAPEARRLANIGFGTGRTTHVLLSSPRAEVVDTIEIEPAVLRASALFRPFNERALDDPRSRIHFDDAKTYFASAPAPYDVILSEPSNPWVSGVAGLFSIEFYGAARRALREGGLFIQWVQFYEMSPPLLATIIAALDANFTDFEIWMANEGDLIIVAANGGKLPSLHLDAFANPRLAAELEHIAVRNADDLLLHRIAGRAVLAPYFAAYGAPPNSDYQPILDVKAAAARYLGQNADDPARLLDAAIPLLEMFDQPRVRRPDPARVSPGARSWFRRAAIAADAQGVALYLGHGEARQLETVPPALATELVVLRGVLVDCQVSIPHATLRDLLAGLASLVNPNLPRAARMALWQQLSASPCSRALPDELRGWLRLHAAIAAEDGRGMISAAERLLAREQLAPQLVPYVLAAHMTGLILEDQRTAAMRSFARHRRRLSGEPGWQPVFRLLVAQAAGA